MVEKKLIDFETLCNGRHKLPGCMNQYLGCEHEYKQETCLVWAKLEEPDLTPDALPMQFNCEECGEEILDAPWVLKLRCPICGGDATPVERVVFKEGDSR